MKKYIAILLVLVLTVTCFSACGKDPATEGKKVIGLLYDAGQDSSTTAIAEAKAYLDEKGIAYKEYTGTTADEVSLAVDAA
ncbi:MAG: hypothetical protein ACI4SX_04205, partial [Candidatus Fimenecus sp.]